MFLLLFLLMAKAAASGRQNKMKNNDCVAPQWVGGLLLAQLAHLSSGSLNVGRFLYTPFAHDDTFLYKHQSWAGANDGLQHYLIRIDKWIG